MKAHRAFTNSQGLAHLADQTEIAANGWNLNIPLYVAPMMTEELSLSDASEALAQAQAEAAKTRAKLEEQLAAWGLA